MAQNLGLSSEIVTLLRRNSCTAREVNIHLPDHSFKSIMS